MLIASATGPANPSTFEINGGTVQASGVGVSGAPGGEKDEVCANAGIAKVADALK